MKNVALTILQKEYFFYSVRIETRQCHFVHIGSAICGVPIRSRQVVQVIMTLALYYEAISMYQAVYFNS